MERDYLIYLILAIGMISLWMYHRKPSKGESKRPRSNWVIVFGIIFVIAVLYLLKQTGVFIENFG